MKFQLIFRAFELLKNTVDRGNYLVTRQCKIIAMTCTHAALKVHIIVTSPTSRREVNWFLWDSDMIT